MDKGDDSNQMNTAEANFVFPSAVNGPCGSSEVEQLVPICRALCTLELCLKLFGADVADARPLELESVLDSRFCLSRHGPWLAEDGDQRSDHVSQMSIQDLSLDRYIQP